MTINMFSLRWVSIILLAFRFCSISAQCPSNLSQRRKSSACPGLGPNDCNNFYAEMTVSGKLSNVPCKWNSNTFICRSDTGCATAAAVSNVPICTKIRNKNTCRVTNKDYCYWINSKKKCFQKEVQPTPNPTQPKAPPTNEPTSPTRKPTSPTPRPTTPEPTGRPTQDPTESTPNPTQRDRTPNPTRRQTPEPTRPQPTPKPTKTDPTPRPTPKPTFDKQELCSLYNQKVTGNFQCTPFINGDLADDVFGALMSCKNGPNCNAENSGKVDRRSSKFCHQHELATDMELKAEEMAIRAAMLNGMSSKCDKWCLFDVYDPVGRSWLWHSAGNCWKKQGNRGKCQKMANSVRRGKEFGHVLDRAFEICDIPREAPRSEWFLGKKRESCSDTCTRISKGELECSAEGINSVNNGRSRQYIGKAFATVGIEKCERIVEGNPDFAYPAYDSSLGQCVTRHPDSKGDPCDEKIGENFKRLCSCVSW